MSSAPRAESPEAVGALVSFLLSTGYTDAGLKALGLTKTRWRGSSELRPLLARKVPEDSPLGLLIRLFFFGELVPASSLRAGLPAEISDCLLKTGMLQAEDDLLAPGCMLVHFRGLLLACDPVRRVQSDSPSDLVLGVHMTTRVLGNCILPLPEAGDVLDLGAGCGTLGLEAALEARHVVGTDINERALEFARFNAALNGITNFETSFGDRFESVKDRRFDLIVSNPPFFLTPGSKLLFTGNSLNLDFFVESLAREAPTMLKDGGYFQMLCEWVEMKNQSWQDRLKDWFCNSGCDVLVFKAYEMSPVDYIAKRSAESTLLHGESRADAQWNELQYFDQRGVERIFGGLVTIRRSAVLPDGRPRSENWFIIDEMDEAPDTPIGDLLLERFAAEDVLGSEGDSRLLSARPQLAKGVTLVHESIQENGEWKPRMMYLERRAGMVRRLGFDSEIADLVALWDGSQDLDSLIGAYSRRKSLPRKHVAKTFLGLARKLAALGLISLVVPRDRRPE